jgi:hypothetical protein
MSSHLQRATPLQPHPRTQAVPEERRGPPGQALWPRQPQRQRRPAQRATKYTLLGSKCEMIVCVRVCVCLCGKVWNCVYYIITCVCLCLCLCFVVCVFVSVWLCTCVCMWPAQRATEYTLFGSKCEMYVCVRVCVCVSLWILESGYLRLCVQVYVYFSVCASHLCVCVCVCLRVRVCMCVCACV